MSTADVVTRIMKIAEPLKMLDMYNKLPDATRIDCCNRFNARAEREIAGWKDMSDNERLEAIDKHVTNLCVQEKKASLYSDKLDELLGTSSLERQTFFASLKRMPEKEAIYASAKYHFERAEMCNALIEKDPPVLTNIEAINLSRAINDSNMLTMLKVKLVK